MHYLICSGRDRHANVLLMNVCGVTRTRIARSPSMPLRRLIFILRLCWHTRMHGWHSRAGESRGRKHRWADPYNGWAGHCWGPRVDSRGRRQHVRRALDHGRTTKGPVIRRRFRTPAAKRGFPCPGKPKENLVLEGINGASRQFYVRRRQKGSTPTRRNRTKAPLRRVWKIE